MYRYRMDIIKISEARWIGSRMMKERSGYTVTRGEPTHRRRVDRQVMSDKEAKSSMEWKPLWQRLIMARHFEVHQAHCATYPKKVPRKRRRMSLTPAKTSHSRSKSHDMLRVIGNFNVCVRNDNSGRDKIIGKK